MDWHLSCLLKLLNLLVSLVQEMEDYVCLHLEPTNSEITCPHCQNQTDEIHQVRSILVRDLSLLGQAVYLKIPRRQFYCPHCQKYTTEPLEFINAQRHHTRRYEEFIYRRVGKSTVKDVSEEEGLTPDEVQGVVKALTREKEKKLGQRCLV